MERCLVPSEWHGLWCDDMWGHMMSYNDFWGKRTRKWLTLEVRERSGVFISRLLELGVSIGEFVGKTANNIFFQKKILLSLTVHIMPSNTPKLIFVLSDPPPPGGPMKWRILADFSDIFYKFSICQPKKNFNEICFWAMAITYHA